MIEGWAERNPLTVLEDVNDCGRACKPQPLILCRGTTSNKWTKTRVCFVTVISSLFPLFETSWFLTDFPQDCIMTFCSTVVYRVIILNYMLSFSSFFIILIWYYMHISSVLHNSIHLRLKGSSSLCTHSPSSLPPFLPSWHLGVPREKQMGIRFH